MANYYQEAMGIVGARNLGPRMTPEQEAELTHQNELAQRAMEYRHMYLDLMRACPQMKAIEIDTLVRDHLRMLENYNPEEAA
jgi:hypothetical protein